MPCLDQNISKWAILIGIDHYPDLGRDDLKGCVCDVRKTSELLCNYYGYKSDHILQLTSPPQADVSETAFARSLSDTWPSYDNIIRSIRTVLKQGRQGDIAYIHFSGYAIQVPSLLPLGRRTRNALDIALVPVSIARDRKYFHDVELSVLLHELVAKGLDVTIVIDGRFALLNITPSQSSAFTLEDLNSLPYDKWREHGLYTWLQCPDPEVPYALLLGRSYLDMKGNREHYDRDTQEWNGYLTGWLHKALIEDGPYVQFRSLYHRLLLEASRLSQNEDMSKGLKAAGDMSRPFLLGDRYRLPWSPTFPALLLREKNQVVLLVEAGAAHGIQVGAHFIAISQSWSKTALCGPDRHGFGIFNTVTVHGLTSTAHLLVDTTPSAKMTAPLDAFLGSGKISSVMSQWPSQANSDKGPTDNPHWPDAEANTTQYLNEQPLSPSMQADLYQQLLHVKSEPWKFSRCVDVTVVGGYRHNSQTSPIYPAFARDGCLNLLSGDFVIIYIQGRWDEELFINVLCFDSAFGITQIYPLKNDGAPSLGKRQRNHAEENTELCLRLRVGLPDLRKADPHFIRASETLKIFVTDQRTSFQCLEMPRIRDEGFLREFSDPGGIFMSSADSGPAHQSEVLSGGTVSSMKLHAEGDDRNKCRDGNWCCFDVGVIVHKTIESLASI